jgi:hypothetical protein
MISKKGARTEISIVSFQKSTTEKVIADLVCQDVNGDLATGSSMNQSLYLILLFSPSVMSLKASIISLVSSGQICPSSNLSRFLFSTV